jgi:hypothetical protein
MRVNGRYRFGQGTFAGGHGNDGDAPIPDLPTLATEPHGTGKFGPEPTFVSALADRWVYRGAVIRTTRISNSRQLIE